MKQQAVTVPDLGGTDEVEVIEVVVADGASVSPEQTLIIVESDKASMEIPAPGAGVVRGISVKVGDRVRQGDTILMLETGSGMEVASVDEPTPAPAPPAKESAAAAASAMTPAANASSVVPAAPIVTSAGDTVTGIQRVQEKEQWRATEQPLQRALPKAALVYAGPAVRQLARDLGVTLADIAGSGPKGRILKEDVQSWVKTRLAAAPANTATVLPSLPEVDFAAFGPVETVALSNIQKATVGNMLRSWLNVPHVTQFDFADVTDLEAFRSSLKPEMQQRNNKLTPLAFLLVAVARALRDHPRFNASLHPDGAQLVLKQYFHVGIAVDTPQGLVVPVIRDVNTKSIWELAAEARELADKARNRKLKLVDMQGSCFTISSLGNIGGEGFTPIVNAPEVAILGVSKLAVRPVWSGTEFLPRKTLPLALSYDHRVINGADAGQFMSSLVATLGDIRRLLL